MKFSSIAVTGVFITGVEASLYSTKYIYRTDTILSKEEVVNLKTAFNNPDMISFACKTILTAREWGNIT